MGPRLNKSTGLAIAAAACVAVFVMAGGIRFVGGAPAANGPAAKARKEGAAALPAHAPAAAPATAPAFPSAVDPKADEVFRKAGDLLASAKRFTYDAHAVSEQVLDSGQKVQFARNLKLAVRRPDGVAATVVGDREDLAFVYDGKTVTLHNRGDNVYGSTPAPAAIDDMFDMLAEKFAMTLPMSDLLFSNPYKALIGRVRSGRYLGTGYVFDTKCHHLAFRQEVVDWELWIEDGPRPLPRKLVITYKEAPGDPQYTAYLSNWNLSADVPDARFSFAPPPGAKKVDFTEPVDAGAGPRPASGAVGAGAGAEGAPRTPAP
jgi:hypothetical protein